LVERYYFIVSFSYHKVNFWTTSINQRRLCVGYQAYDLKVAEMKEGAHINQEIVPYAV